MNYNPESDHSGPSARQFGGTVVVFATASVYVCDVCTCRRCAQRLCTCRSGHVSSLCTAPVHVASCTRVIVVHRLCTRRRRRVLVFRPSRRHAAPQRRCRRPAVMNSEHRASTTRQKCTSPTDTIDRYSL